MLKKVIVTDILDNIRKEIYKKLINGLSFLKIVRFIFLFTPPNLND